MTDALFIKNLEFKQQITQSLFEQYLVKGKKFTLGELYSDVIDHGGTIVLESGLNQNYSTFMKKYLENLIRCGCAEFNEETKEYTILDDVEF